MQDELGFSHWELKVLAGLHQSRQVKGETKSVVKLHSSLPVEYLALFYTHQRPNVLLSNSPQRPYGNILMYSMPAGGLAGAIAWWSVYPLDVIKSRIQASSRAESEYKGELPSWLVNSQLVACTVC